MADISKINVNNTEYKLKDATALRQSDVVSTYTSTSTAPVNGKAIKAALDTLDVGSVGGAGSYIRSISETNGKISSTPVNFDTALSSSSTDDNAPTSKTVYNDQQRQETEIGVVANVGAKNLLNITERSRVHQGVTFIVNSDESVSISGGTTGSNSFIRLTGSQSSTAYSEQIPLPKGRYKISCPGALSTDNFRFAVGYRNTSSESRSTVTAQQSNGFEAEFEITTDTGRFDAAVLSVSTSQTYSATVYPMIRRVEILDNTFVPYAPSNRELYEMILQLQSAAGLRTVSSLSSATAPLEDENFVEEEVIEDEER